MNDELNTFKITIGKISEQQIVEDCLTKYHSGYDYKLILVLYALAKKWNVNKLTYYINLIEGEK